MASRLTDTDKWKKPFIRSLKAGYKLLWLYICDDCDHSGIWHVDIEVAQIRTGEKLKIDDAIRIFAGKIIVFDGGKKWFIPSFIEFQYPSGLKKNNKVHESVIKNLSKYNLIDEDLRPLGSPLEGAKDKEKDKEEDKDKEIDKDNVPEKPKTIYERFTDAYFSWYEKRNDVKPKFDGQSGKAMKSIISYLVSVAKDKKHPPELQESEALKSWEYILSNWYKIDPFVQGQVNITQISSNINRIINDLKNGVKKSDKRPTGGEVSSESLARKIAYLADQTQPS